ncbi:MAG: hypothetical protein J7K12_05210, partial [Thermoplasmata archaeon]|nr:hypothetical protein [Thermoplasmata archaeon]
PLYINASDDGAGIKEIHYIIDGVEHVAYENVVTNIVGNDGWYTIEYYSIDNVRNEEEHHVVTYYLDNTPPTTTIILNPSSPDGENGWYRSNVTVSFSSNDVTGVSKIYYKIDNSAWNVYSHPILLEGNIYHVYYYAIDSVGNSEVVHYREIKIDFTPPAARFVAAPPHLGNSGDVYFEWESDDAEAIYSYKLENYSEWSSWSYDRDCRFRLGEGNYTFKLRAKDEAGNEASISYNFSINFSLLVTAFNAYPRKNEWIGLNSSINFTIRRAITYYRIWHNGWNPAPGTGEGKGNNFTLYDENFTLWSLGYRTEGKYYIEFYSVVGEVIEETRNESIMVDRIPPTVAIHFPENITCKPNITLEINAIDSNGIKSITLYYSYSKSKNWSEWNEMQSNKFNFSDAGFYAFKVKCEDYFGNANYSDIVVIKFYEPDLNNDGMVNIFDIVELTNYWDSNSYIYDLNGDGRVGYDDVALIFKSWK